MPTLFPVKPATTSICSSTSSFCIALEESSGESAENSTWVQQYSNTLIQAYRSKLSDSSEL